MGRLLFIAATAWIAAAPVAAQMPEAMSLLGKPLYAPAPKGTAREKAESDLAAARAALAKDPSSAEAALALGDAQAADGHLLDAIETYTIAIEQHPADGRLLLARGRRLVVIRRFDIAIRDFRKASDTRPDAQCSLAFAEYLHADYNEAEAAFKACPQSPWAPAAAARVGAPLVPPSSDDALVTAYYAALRLVLRKDVAHAREELNRIVDKQGERWMEDGYIAAEAELARLPRKHKKKK